MTSIHENAEQAICPLFHDEMESVSGGGLQIPPYHDVAWGPCSYPGPAGVQGSDRRASSQANWRTAPVTADQCSQSRHSSYAGFGILL